VVEARNFPGSDPFLLRYVLDTNILVAALNGDPAVIARLNEADPFEEAILPAIVARGDGYAALVSFELPAVKLERGGARDGLISAG
jgi:predicted nucleic acid-binding protein